LNTFPSEESIAELRASGATHVAVHTQAFVRRYSPDTLALIETLPALEFVAEEDGIRLYRLK
jgi:hypothetical protein